MVKDRLDELQAARGSEDSVIIVVDPDEILLKEFFQEVEEIQEHINKIKTNVTEVKKRQDDIKFLDPEGEKRIRKELDALLESIKKSAKKARAKLNSIEQNSEKIDSDDTDIKRRIVVFQLNCLTIEFVEAMQENNDVQNEYKKSCAGMLKKQLQICGRVISDDEIEEMLESGNMDVFTEGLVMETKRAQEALDNIKARHALLLKIEESVREVQDMFINMSLLVQNQGEAIDRIEHYVRNTAEYVEKGKEHLKQALKLQKKRTKIKCICAGVIAAIIAVIACVIGFQLTS